jgi:WD40 repeat protein
VTIFAAALATAVTYARTIPIADHGRSPIALSRDGGRLATRESSGVRVRIFETAGMREIGGAQPPKHQYEYLAALAFSPDGATLAGVSVSAVVWSTADWKVRWSLPESQAISAIAYSPDGKTLYAAGDSSMLAAYDAASGTPRWKLPPAGTTSYRIAISPDGALAAVGSVGGGLRLLSTSDGKVVASLSDRKNYGGRSTAAQRAGWLAHPGTIDALGFTRDGTRLVSSGNDGTIKSWNVAQRSLAWTNVCGATPNALAFEAGDRAVDAGCGWTVRRLDARTGKILPSLHSHGGDVDALAAEPGGKYLWSAAEDGTLKRWDLTRRTERSTYGAIATAALTPGGRWFAFGRGDDAIALVDLSSDRQVETLRGNVLPKTLGSYSYSRAALAISADGAYLGAGGYVTEGFIDHTGVAKGVMRVWRRTHAQPFRASDATPALIRFSPDDRTVVARSPAMSDTPDSVWTLALDARRSALAMRGYAGTSASVRVAKWTAQWNLSRPDGTVLTCRLDGFDDSAIVFSTPTPSLLVVSSSGTCPGNSASTTQALRLWGIGSRSPSSSPGASSAFGPSETSPLGSLALSADERTAVTFDGRLGVWNVARRRLIVRGPLTKPVGDNYSEMTEFATGGSHALGLVLYDSSHTGNRDRYELVVWDLHTGQLIERSARRPALEHSHLLVRADGTRAYVSSPSGLDVWVLRHPAAIAVQ